MQTQQTLDLLDVKRSIKEQAKNVKGYSAINTNLKTWKNSHWWKTLYMWILWQKIQYIKNNEKSENNSDWWKTLCL